MINFSKRYISYYYNNIKHYKKSNDNYKFYKGLLVFNPVFAAYCCKNRVDAKKKKSS